MLIKEDEIEFLKEFFPDLYVKGNIISGNLKFVVYFSKRNKEYKLLKWETKAQESNFLIRDSYQIEIDLSPEKNIYREVTNSDERILKRAIAKGVPSSDLHVYDNGTYKNKICLWGYLDEDKNINFREFLCDKVVPFFYDQSFHEKYGTWPRGEYSHGYLGILENYYDICIKSSTPDDVTTKKCISSMKDIASNNLDKNTWENIKEYLSQKKIKRHWPCVGKNNDCRLRSKKCNWIQFCECHNHAFLGLRILHKQIRSKSLKYLIL
jgi:hypothetical protein